MPSVDSVEIPDLTDGVIRLRAHRSADRDRIWQQFTDPATLQWTNVAPEQTLQSVEEWVQQARRDWRSDTKRRWAIEECADPEGLFLGTVNLTPAAAGRGEIGFGLHPQARGRGLATRAVELICQAWFAEGGQRLDWYAAAGNLASWAVAHRLGFGFIATLPEHTPDGAGRLVDTWFASLGRDETRTPRTRWITPPVLEQDGIRLRPWRDADVEAVEPADHPAHFVPAVAIPTPDNWADWMSRRRFVMARGTSVNWCIADAATDRALGEMLVFVHDGEVTGADTAELGYYLFPSARGRGATRRAAHLAVRHARTAQSQGGLGVRRLIAETAADNAASNAILPALGFRRWGHEAAALAPDDSIGPADHWELVTGT